jgi:hypothetical protein
VALQVNSVKDKLKARYAINKHMKKCSRSLAIKEMKIKKTLIFHLIPIRMTAINNANKKHAGEDVGEDDLVPCC